ncbi:MAG: TonB-dependent receptor [Saprospiraceae bacterium]|nr:TonB-dependent receptor [Candidatus Brachybacter algidus]
MKPKSNLSVYKENNFRWVWDNTVTFNKKIDAHTFTLLVGSTAEEYTAENIRAFRQDVPADKNLWYIGTGDANTSTNGGGGEKWTRSAYLSRLNYNFDDRFLFTGTMRYDGSSRLSKDNRWGFFPSVGAGWVLTNESFLKDVNYLDNLKLRASWGKVGNDRVPTDAFVVTLRTQSKLSIWRRARCAGKRNYPNQRSES